LVLGLRHGVLTYERSRERVLVATGSVADEATGAVPEEEAVRLLCGRR
jgi:hypothetical protein